MIADDRVPAANSRTVDLAVDGNPLPVHYLQAGTEGPPVVLLHGSGVDDAALSWKHAIPALAEDYRVYAPDWPGYGDSPAGEHAMTTRYYAAILEGFLAAVSVDRPSLVGISMGGGVGLGYALGDPGRIERLVIVDSYGLRNAVPGGASAYLMANTPFADAIGSLVPATRTAARMAVGPFLYDADGMPGAFYEDVADRLRGRGAGRSFVRFQRNEFSPDGVSTDYSDRLEELDVPTLLIHGADDPLVPVEWSVAAHERLPKSQLCVLERCGHWPPRERPEAFNDALATFLEDGE